jgi:hypothetical protein
LGPSWIFNGGRCHTWHGWHARQAGMKPENWRWCHPLCNSVLCVYVSCSDTVEWGPLASECIRHISAQTWTCMGSSDQ